MSSSYESGLILRSSDLLRTDSTSQLLLVSSCSVVCAVEELDSSISSSDSCSDAISHVPCGRVMCAYAS